MKWLDFAAVQVTPQESGISNLPNALRSGNLSTGLRIAFGMAGGIALVVVAYGALRYVLSQGDPQAINKAKNTIIDGLIGLAIIVASGGIVTFVTVALT